MTIFLATLLRISTDFAISVHRKLGLKEAVKQSFRTFEIAKSFVFAFYISKLASDKSFFMLYSLE